MLARIFAVFVILLSTPQFAFAQAGKPVKLTNVQFSTPPEGPKVVLNFAAEPNRYSYFTLQNPRRLVIDLPATKLAAKLPAVQDSLIKKIRTSKAKKSGDLRLVIELNGDKPVKLSNWKNAVIVQFDRPNLQAPVLTDRDVVQRDKDIIIALDAGHGGRDPGSVGPNGTYEKNITLAIARRLAKLINNTDGMRAVLIRDGNYYLSPSARPNIARKKDADLLISIHADAFHKPGPKGASVWVLNNRRANSELGKWMERKERHAELLGGAAEVLEETTEDKYLVRTLLDMASEHSMTSSFVLSEKVLNELKRITTLHKKQPQHASLAVLTAPDIPSILVEVGFISNPTEEKNLQWAKFQQRIAQSIHRATVDFFHAAPPEGTLWASNRSGRVHTVKSGENLSLIAARYQTSVDRLVKTNQLRSTVLKVGQQLQIP